MVVALGYIFIGMASLFFPRVVLAVMGGIFFGGWWWFLFVPLIIFAIYLEVGLL